MRVVIDTNILVSFAIRPNEIFEQMFDYLARKGITLISDDTVAELFTVLNRDKFRKYIRLDSAMDYIEWYVGISESVSVTKSVIACRDPKDDKFLSLAVAGRADCIIAGDSDLLDMIAYEGIPIYRATDFLKLFCQ
ncbi:MAG: putative toxin-antitoxin system toxin component, PIN family [Microcystis sp.]|jgi:putative PIN family toxin of toxin-antitoxin system